MKTMILILMNIRAFKSIRDSFQCFHHGSIKGWHHFVSFLSRRQLLLCAEKAECVDMHGRSKQARDDVAEKGVRDCIKKGVREGCDEILSI